MSKLVLMGEELEITDVKVSFVGFRKGVLGTIQLVADGENGPDVLWAVTRLFEPDEFYHSDDMGVSLLMEKLRAEIHNEGGLIVKEDGDES